MIRKLHFKGRKLPIFIKNLHNSLTFKNTNRHYFNKVIFKAVKFYLDESSKNIFLPVTTGNIVIYVILYIQLFHHTHRELVPGIPMDTKVYTCSSPLN
jgi:hypothetical protein